MNLLCVYNESCCIFSSSFWRFLFQLGVGYVLIGQFDFWDKELRKLNWVGALQVINQIKLILETSPSSWVDSTTYTVLVPPWICHHGSKRFNLSRRKQHSFAGLDIGITGTYYDTLVNGNNCAFNCSTQLTVLPNFCILFRSVHLFGESFQF